MFSRNSVLRWQFLSTASRHFLFFSPDQIEFKEFSFLQSLIWKLGDMQLTLYPLKKCAEIRIQVSHSCKFSSQNPFCAPGEGGRGRWGRVKINILPNFPVFFSLGLGEVINAFNLYYCPILNPYVFCGFTFLFPESWV